MFSKSKIKYFGGNMKKNYSKKLLTAFVALGMFLAFSSCSDDSNESDDSAVSGFVKITGGTVEVADSSDAESKGPKNSKVFIEGRRLTIKSLYVSDHEVTQEEFEKYNFFEDGPVVSMGGPVKDRNAGVMTGNPVREGKKEIDDYYGSDEHKRETVPSAVSGKGKNYPAHGINWYDTLVYSNLRSIDEGFTPVYSIKGETNPRKWPGIIENDEGKYAALHRITSGENQNFGDGGNGDIEAWDAVEFDLNANGYRLPTEVEWEYIARGGNNGTFPKQTKYPGSDNIDEVAWYEGNAGLSTHPVKSKKPVNGIYDLAGNVSEWVWDFLGDEITANTPYTGPATRTKTSTVTYNQRVFRGGSAISEERLSAISEILIPKDENQKTEISNIPTRGPWARRNKKCSLNCGCGCFHALFGFRVVRNAD